MGWFDDNTYDGSPLNDPANPPPYRSTDGSPQDVTPAQIQSSALPPGATMTSEGPVMSTPGYTPPAAPAMGANGSVSVPRPGVNPSVVYTDQRGMGYDPGTLATKWADPAFRNDPANARVGDILAQYRAAAAGGPPPGSNLVAPGLMDLLGSSPLLRPWNQPMPAGMTTPFDQGPQFKAPTLDEVKQTPGYQFTLQQGIDALQKSAAAKGTLLTGGMMKSLEEFGSGLADSTYQQQFNNAYQTWAGNNANRYQTWAGNQTQAAQNYGTEYNIYRGNQVQPFDMLSVLSNGGQAAAQNLNSASMGVGANAGNTMMGIGNAQAAGTVGGANAANSAIGNAGNSAMLWSLMNKSSYGGGNGGPSPMNPYADFA